MAFDRFQNPGGSRGAAEGRHGRLLLSKIFENVPEDLSSHGFDHIADSHTA